MTVETTPSRDLDHLTRQAAEVLPDREALAALLEQGRPLRVKLGFDPTRPDLHLGHAVVLHALRRFQDAGHQVVVIIGDFTARIGDPTGKKAARPPLTKDEVRANARTYLDQLWLILDRARTEVRYNSEWLGAIGLADVIRLMATTTLQRTMEREDFAKRWNSHQPIHLHELLYPLLQGQDSVAIRADIEMGGTDQKFNNLKGRELQEAAGQPPQIVMLYPILVGLDGIEKMSKSLDNYIGLTDSAEQMYIKVMTLPDTAMRPYFLLASGLTEVEANRVLAEVAEGRLHPRNAKMRLARAVAALYHGMEAAEAAEAEWLRQKEQLPSNIEAVPVEPGLPLGRLLVALGLVKTTSEARRKLAEHAVRFHRADGTVQEAALEAVNAPVEIPREGLVVQVGKHQFRRVLGVLQA